MRLRNKIREVGRIKVEKMTKLERIKEYCRLMKILYDALKKPIDNPVQKHPKLTIPYNIHKYQETIKFIKENYPKYYYKQYNLSLLNKEIETLSEDDLIDWQLEVARVRGSLLRS